MMTILSWITAAVTKKGQRKRSKNIAENLTMQINPMVGYRRC